MSKTIEISLDKKSIDKAIEELKKAQGQLNTQMLAKFKERLCHWIVERADIYLEQSGVGNFVIADIRNSWKYPTDYTQDVIVLKNTSEKAVFVEFGTGMAGAETPHYLAGQQGYEYSVGHYILSDGTWIFKSASMAAADVPLSHIYNITLRTIRTDGTPAAMYAYNAVVDAMTELRSTNGGEIGEIWKKIVDEYWVK